MREFGIVVSAKYQEGKRGQSQGAYWAELLANNRPDRVKLTIRIQPSDSDLTVFAIRGATGVPLERGVFFLDVPVSWKDGVPSTRREPEDNVDIVFLGPTGFFTEIQVGLITRGGKFFATIQKIWRGWAVFPEKGDVQYIPADPEHAYPGSSFGMIDFRKEEVLKLTGSVATSVNEALGGAKADPIPAEWKPNLPRAKKPGWERGTVLFFNLVTGTGQVLGEDEERFFVHFRNILPNNDGDSVKILAPLQGVYFRLDKQEPEPGQIRRIRSCLPT